MNEYNRPGFMHEEMVEFEEFERLDDEDDKVSLKLFIIVMVVASISLAVVGYFLLGAVK